MLTFKEFITENEDKPDWIKNTLDVVQGGLALAGTVDPTPVTDAVNTAISLGRGVFGDKEDRSTHLTNAALSAVSMVPYVGDALGKPAMLGVNARRAARVIGDISRSRLGNRGGVVIPSSTSSSNTINAVAESHDKKTLMGLPTEKLKKLHTKYSAQDTDESEEEANTIKNILKSRK